MIHIQESTVRAVSDSEGLDKLIESVGASYNIPASIIPDMKSGLESALYEYLFKFISENNIQLNESAGVGIKLDSAIENGNVDIILESARLNNVVNVTYKGKDMIKIINMPESITYQLGESVDVSKITPTELVEAWKCKDLANMKPLLLSLINTIKEESK